MTRCLAAVIRAIAAGSTIVPVRRVARHAADDSDSAHSRRAGPFSVAHAGRRRHGLEQLSPRTGPRRGPADLSPRHVARDVADGRVDGRARTHPRAVPAGGARLPRALRRTPARPASVGGARRGHQHLSHRRQRAALPRPRRKDAGLPHRRDLGTRGGAPHLPRRRAPAARLGCTAAGGRHRRRVDRVHHRRWLRHAAARVAGHRLRVGVAALLRWRRPVGGGLSRRGPRSRRSHAISTASAGTTRSRRPERRSRWRRSSSRTACRRAASRRKACVRCARG